MMINGDKIQLDSKAVYYNGKPIPDWVKKSTLYYRGTNSNGVKISTQKTGDITGIVNAKYVKTLTTTPAKDYKKLGQAVEKCLSKIESLPEFKEVVKLL